MKKRHALLTVSDKKGLDGFARVLTRYGFDFVASRNTAAFLRENNITNVEDAEHITGFPPLAGRQGIKLIHPKIFTGILADPTNPEHVSELLMHRIHRFEIVVCNFYPFEQTIAKVDFKHEEAIFNLDIGGPAMVRCAAKNYAHTTCVVDTADYALVLQEVLAGGVSPRTRQALSLKAFKYCVAYDQAIIQYLEQQVGIQKE